MFTHEQIEAMPEGIYKRLRDINTQYLEILGKRIAEVGEIIPTDVYKLQRIFESGVDIKEIETALSKANRMNIREIESLFDDVAEESYNFYKPFYEFRKKPFIPYEENSELQDYVKALAKQTVDEYKNLTQHTAFAVFSDKKCKSIAPLFEANKNKAATSLSDTYTKVIDYAVTKTQLGVADYQSAMRDCLKALADSGIKTVDYASGYSRRLDTSVRQNILWGIKQCNQEIADMVGEEIGADGYEISYHSNPRPSHADMGGRLYAKGEGRTINGIHYPSIDTVQPLLDEYNCLHFKFSVILGLSEPTYSKKELAKLKAKDNKPVMFEGKEITKYEASQKQHTLETAMRHCDDRLTIAKAADNEILILKETERMRQLQNKYNELSKASGLPTKWERTVSGLKTSKKSLTKGSGSGIMKLADKGQSDTLNYLVKVDPDGIRIAKEFIANELQISKCDLGDLKNADVIMPLLNKTKKLQDKYKQRYNAIIVDALMSGKKDIAWVTPSRELHLNPDYFNSREAITDVLREFVKKSIIPKGCGNINFVAKHEYVHLMTKEIIDDPKSTAHVIYKRNYNTTISYNAKINTYEFVADYLAYPNKNKVKEELKNYFGLEDIDD